jgi:hypothetical protein
MVDERLDIYVDMSEDLKNYQANLNQLYLLGHKDEVGSDDGGENK